MSTSLSLRRNVAFFTTVMLAGVLALGTAGRSAEPEEEGTAPEPTGKKVSRGEAMDYGSFLSYSVTEPRPPAAAKAATTKPAAKVGTAKAGTSPATKPSATPKMKEPPVLADKGITVRLGHDACVLFDTDLLRYAAGWTGGFLDVTKTNIGGLKGDFPAAVQGKLQFTTPKEPGWTKNGSYNDPRLSHQGPLPKDWAHYRGLYRNGEKVIFSYDIGGVGVLDMPGAVAADGMVAFTRTLYVEKSNVDLRLLSLDMEGLKDVVHPVNKMVEGVGLTYAVAASGPNGSYWVVVMASNPGSPIPDVPIGGGNERHRLSLNISARPSAVTFKVVIFKTPLQLQDKQWEALVRAAAGADDLPALCKGGPAQWKEPVITEGTLGDEPAELAKGAKPKEDQAAKLEKQAADPDAAADEKKDLLAKAADFRADAKALLHPAYVTDTITLPEPNPWKSWIRPGGFDFFSDGRCAVCTMNGDVWIVSGIDKDLKHLSWRRFAAGLYEPLGLKIVKDQIYVLGRDQITRLHDLNGDGEADFYENFNNDCVCSPIYHAFAFDLWTDSNGSFYYVRDGNQVPLSTPMRGCLMRVSPDGEYSEIVATGFRAANGMGVGPHDEIVAGDNQGHWTPSSKINLVKPGGFYGYVGDPRRLTKAEMDMVQQRESAAHGGSFDPPLCWIPYDWDNSSGGQMWMTGDRWGPLANHMLHLSYGKCTLFEVMWEEVSGPNANGNGAAGKIAQGGVVQVPVTFASGVMRGRENPRDGQLYVCGLKGWQTSAGKDGCFQRVRYTGAPLYLPTDLHVKHDGIAVTFSQPLEEATAADADNYRVEEFVYKWWSTYGSPEFKASAPNVKGHDVLDVKSVKLSADRRTVFLAIDDLKPVQQMEIKMKVKAADGTAIRCAIGNTINQVGP